jgi:hypothetical protein
MGLNALALVFMIVYLGRKLDRFESRINAAIDRVAARG